MNPILTITFFITMFSYTEIPLKCIVYRMIFKKVFNVYFLLLNIESSKLNFINTKLSPLMNYLPYT